MLSLFMSFTSLFAGLGSTKTTAKAVVGAKLAIGHQAEKGLERAQEMFRQDYNPVYDKAGARAFSDPSMPYGLDGKVTTADERAHLRSGAAPTGRMLAAFAARKKDDTFFF